MCVCVRACVHARVCVCVCVCVCMCACDNTHMYGMQGGLARANASL